MRHLTGYVYIFLLSCTFAAIVAWNNQQTYGQVSPVQALREVLGRTPPKAGNELRGIQEIISLDSPVSTHRKDQNSATFDPNDVLFMFKTSASTMWERTPMHLATTFANKTLTPDVVIYSDLDASIGGYRAIDVLANVSTALKSHPDFEYYHQLKRPAGERGLQVDGEDVHNPTLAGSWRIDKYKFLPLVQHAALNFPEKKWYVFLEDDSFIFIEPFMAWLAQSYDWREPTLAGSPASSSAHGGSIFALSQGAVRKSFLADPQLAEKWEEYSIQQGSGAQVLSHVLATKGIKRAHNGEDDVAMPVRGLQDLGVAERNWCSPLLTLHRAHQSDLSALHAWGKDFSAKKGKDVPPRYRDVFLDLISPHINEMEREDWDNYADWKRIAPTADVEYGEEIMEDERSSKMAWSSAGACKQACKSEKPCMMWKYSDGICYLGEAVKRGRRSSSEVRVKSGWMLDRIRDLEKNECK
ncbi:hypothetical protein B0J12DRAFT_562235 [Macrophomina phaseolina]|uniref:Glycosyltransferase family 31 protein n=1 Tax=Macrophomina phaseolina TaxID=35725 RepID=A0ABQ8GRD2_9PEZI|nr:hypothetical protein B0J12DRAFT_562235 [Macrophomina phaseolina]